MQDIINWWNGEDIKIRYKANKISADEAVKQMNTRKYIIIISMLFITILLGVTI